ncbi:MAG: tRNA (N6-isopentenyl adenosine(37)-C2)-methylthiotransferase MiaB [Bacteroidales bacterium]|nr:tRNA (N6-isopentenyl adenosine(37)-C2)-methylthiotransferase MiaB [Bacteroidales bacterium]
MKKLFIETYGCQMNVADSEVVAAILANDYEITDSESDADLILINTCSIRDNAEQRIHKRLKELTALKKRKNGMQIGLLGCMAERLQEKLLGNGSVLDFVAGPDTYRTLPELIKKAQTEENVFNVELSRTETYDDILPVRYSTNGVSAFISIMRGCNNFCSYCVVPYTRGRERSRAPQTILNEAKDLIAKGYKEITLLGQNVDSYHWQKENETVTFANLMEMVAQLDPQVRIRYATSHPKDISDELLYVMAKYENICKFIHLPVQHGNNEMLKKMNRSYTREHYLSRISKIREIMPDCAIATDVIAGFCGETEDQHKETLTLMQEVGYSFAYMFKYSEREGTLASKKYEDDIPDDIKTARLEEIIALQQQLSLESNQQDLGKSFKVLVEGTSRRSDKQLFGRNSQNKVIVFPKGNVQKGDYVTVKVIDCTAATLIGETE